MLAIEPGVCVMISGFPKTKEALEKNGVKVHTFNGDSLCILTDPTIVDPASAKKDLHEMLPKIEPEPLNITETLLMLPITLE